MTLFTSFMEMLDDLGISPQPDERDPYGTIRSQQVMTKLEKVRDFPVDRLPEIAEYAKKVEALNPDALIKKMRAMIAQGPKQTGVNILDDNWILAYYTAKIETLCEPVCETCDPNRENWEAIVT